MSEVEREKKSSYDFCSHTFFFFSKEIFPDSLGFNIIRRDRKGDPHGGVIIAARHDLGLTQSFCSDKTELISGNIKIGPRKSISLFFFNL